MGDQAGEAGQLQLKLAGITMVERRSDVGKLGLSTGGGQAKLARPASDTATHVYLVAGLLGYGV